MGTLRCWCSFLQQQGCSDLYTVLCCLHPSESGAIVIWGILTETLGYIEVIWHMLITQRMNTLSHCMEKKEFYCKTGLGRHLWHITTCKCTQTHTHILNFSITENNILAFFDYGSTQGKEKIRTVTLILIVKLRLQAGKKVLVLFCFFPQSRMKTSLVC